MPYCSLTKQGISKTQMTIPSHGISNSKFNQFGGAEIEQSTCSNLSKKRPQLGNPSTSQRTWLCSCFSLVFKICSGSIQNSSYFTSSLSSRSRICHGLGTYFLSKLNMKYIRHMQLWGNASMQNFSPYPSKNFQRSHNIRKITLYTCLS